MHLACAGRGVVGSGLGLPEPFHWALVQSHHAVNARPPSGLEIKSGGEFGGRKGAAGAARSLAGAWRACCPCEGRKPGNQQLNGHLLNCHHLRARGVVLVRVFQGFLSSRKAENWQGVSNRVLERTRALILM